jgi:hypothetical protein
LFLRNLATLDKVDHEQVIPDRMGEVGQKNSRVFQMVHNKQKKSTNYEELLNFKLLMYEYAKTVIFVYL